MQLRAENAATRSGLDNRGVLDGGSLQDRGDASLQLGTDNVTKIKLDDRGRKDRGSLQVGCRKFRE